MSPIGNEPCVLIVSHLRFECKRRPCADMSHDTRDACVHHTMIHVLNILSTIQATQTQRSETNTEATGDCVSHTFLFYFLKEMVSGSGSLSQCSYPVREEPKATAPHMYVYTYIVICVYIYTLYMVVYYNIILYYIIHSIASCATTSSA